MLLHISSENLQHLALLQDADEPTVQEFGNISLQFLTNGINRKIFKVAAQKLHVDIAAVEKAVIGLMQLYAEASKNGIRESDLFDSLIALEFSEHSAKVLSDLYAGYSKDTRTVLVQCAPTLPTYEDLEWRLDVRLATRSLHQQVVPNILLKFHTCSGTEKSSKLIRTDPVNLLHMTNVLEDALGELKSNHVRRIVRTIT